MRLESSPLPYLRELKRIREARFLSQRELARLADVGLVTINRLESGRVNARFSTARKLAEALGVEPSALVDQTEETSR